MTSPSIRTGVPANLLLPIVGTDFDHDPQAGTIQVNLTPAVAETPTTGTPASVTTSEGQAVTLTGLSVTEASGDSGDTINVTLSVGNGTLSVGSHNGLTGTFSGSALTFSGLASAVNTALGSVSYTPTSEFEGTDTVHFKAMRDGGSRGLDQRTEHGSHRDDHGDRGRGHADDLHPPPM